MGVSKIKKVGTIIIFLIILIMFILLIVSNMKFLVQKIKTTILGEIPIEDDSITIKWKEIYPFKDEKKNEDDIIQDSNKKNLERVKNLIQKIENKTSKEIIGYEKFAELSYIYDKMIMYTLSSNNSIDTRINIDGYWCKINPIPIYANTKKDILKKFKEYLQEKNINLLYVQAPSKIENNIESNLKIYQSYGNRNANNVIDEINKDIDRKIDYIDLRQKVKHTGKDYLNLFFKTDHHWKPETGVWATGEIADYLNKHFNYRINKELISNIDNYNIDICENAYLGSDGRYVTLANTKKENISIVTPKFSTYLTVEILDKGVNQKGTFKETLMDFDLLDYFLDAKDDYATYHYTIYGYGDRPLIEIHNNIVNDGKKILIIKDSFADVVIPYLSLGVEYCSAVDLRHFSGSLDSYIDEYKPDTVIVLFYIDDILMLNDIEENIFFNN